MSPSRFWIINCASTVMNGTLSTPVAVLLLLALSGCSGGSRFADDSTSQLEVWMNQEKFTPFNPPRTGDGVGAIISFNDKGEETIVSAPDECMDLSSLLPSPDPVAILDSEYEITSQSGLEWSGLPKQISAQADLSAAIGRAGVKKIKIDYNRPSRNRITVNAVKNYIRSLAETSSCLEELKRPGNLLIHTIIGANGLTYSFYGDNETKITLNAELLNAIKLSPETVQKYVGTAGISLGENDLGNKPLLLGYRAWRVEKLPGALENEVQVIPLDPEDIVEIRQAATVQ